MPFRGLVWPVVPQICLSDIIGVVVDQGSFDDFDEQYNLIASPSDW